MSKEVFPYSCPRCIICGIEEKLFLTLEERDSLFLSMAGNKVECDSPRMNMIRTGYHDACLEGQDMDMKLW